MNLVEKVRQLTDSIIAAKDPMQVQRDWEMLERLLGRLPLDPGESQAVCASRDADALDALVSKAEHPEPAAPPEPGRDIPEEELVSAMRAFRKRLKLARLSDESKLGGRQLTAGKKSQIDAIIPPTKFPPDVWRALAAAGKLEHTGEGFYQLIK